MGPSEEEAAWEEAYQLADWWVGWNARARSIKFWILKDFQADVTQMGTMAGRYLSEWLMRYCCL